MLVKSDMERGGREDEERGDWRRGGTGGEGGLEGSRVKE